MVACQLAIPTAGRECVGRGICGSNAHARTAFGFAEKVINDRPKQWQKDDDQNPHDLLATGQTFVGDGMDEHPNPKDRGQQSDNVTNHRLSPSLISVMLGTTTPLSDGTW